MTSIISEGKTTTEAIENGLKQLKVSKKDVNIKILEEDKRSFFSILAPKVVKVELTVKEENVRKSQKKKKQKFIYQKKTLKRQNQILKLF